MSNQSDGSTTNTGLLSFNLAIAAGLFVIMGTFFILLSGWHESAIVAQGFLISLILLIVLADAANINAEMNTIINAVSSISSAHKVA